MGLHSSVVIKYCIRLKYKWGHYHVLFLAALPSNKCIATQWKEEHETVLNNVQFHNSYVNGILWSWTDQRILWTNYAIKAKAESDRGKGGREGKEETSKSREKMSNKLKVWMRGRDQMNNLLLCMHLCLLGVTLSTSNLFWQLHFEWNIISARNEVLHSWILGIHIEAVRMDEGHKAKDFVTGDLGLHLISACG